MNRQKKILPSEERENLRDVLAGCSGQECPGPGVLRGLMKCRCNLPYRQHPTGIFGGEDVRLAEDRVPIGYGGGLDFCCGARHCDGALDGAAGSSAAVR